MLKQNACNIFSANQTIGNVTHQGWAGGQDYTSGKGVYLPTAPKTSQGSAYLLLFNFLPGTWYTISITTSGGDGGTMLGLSTSVDGTSVNNNYPITTSNVCGTDPKVNSYTVGNYARNQSPVGSTSNTITLTTFNPAALQQYLVIWAIGGDARLSADGFYISDINIKASTASFSITPSVISLNCGSAISQTLVANNNGQIPGVSLYTWNLGTTPNNWYLNGSPARATETTTTNTIVLTVPACAPLPTTSVTVTASIPPYGNFNSSSSSIATTAMSINGPPSMCGQPTLYQVPNLTCPNASVNWSASPAGNVSFSCTTCNQTTLTKIVNGSSITLTASVTGACSASPIILTKPVTVDAPNTLTGTYSTSTNTYPLNTVNFVKGGVINGQYNWGSVTNQTLTHSGTASWSYGGNGTFGFYISTGQNMYLNFSGISSVCGTVTDQRTFIQSSFGNLVVTASPVPTSSNLTVSLDQVPDTTITLEKAQSLSTTTFKQETKISILEINSGNLVKQWNFKENEATSYNIDVSGIKAGIYILKVERNNRIANSKVVIQ